MILLLRGQRSHLLDSQQFLKPGQAMIACRSLAKFVKFPSHIREAVGLIVEQRLTRRVGLARPTILGIDDPSVIEDAPPDFPAKPEIPASGEFAEFPPVPSVRGFPLC